MNAYEARIERRRERLEAKADRIERESANRIKRAREMADCIPFGQPILVGHHSEKADRSFRAKINNNFAKGYSGFKEAERVRAKAEAVGTGGISSDDPDAITKLKEELEKAEVGQRTMVAANKVVRSAIRSGLNAGSTEEELAGYYDKMSAAGVTSSAAARKLLEPDCCGRIGFPDYATSNNSANIRRIKQRIAQLEAASVRTTRSHEANGIRLVQNVEANRIQLIFPGKPQVAVIAELKSSGFRWSPTEGAWQRQLNNAGIWNAERLFEKFTKEEA